MTRSNTQDEECEISPMNQDEVQSKSYFNETSFAEEIKKD